MLRKIAVLSALILMSSCSTPEFREEKAICTTTWMSKLPPKYEQELYNEPRTREVPTGQTNCAKNGNSMTCIDVMRTEYYTVPVVRTVDRNKAERDARISVCTQNRCLETFGNAECKA